MKYGFFKIMILAVVAVFSSSCVQYDVDEILIGRNDVSLTWKGEDQIVYDPLTFQLSCNSKKHEYRVNDDNMANYFVVMFSEKPSAEGQDLSANVEWTVSSNIKRYEGLRFTVRKVAGDGTVWLWNRSQKIGVVIKEVE